MLLQWLSVASGVIALVIAILFSRAILKKDSGNQKMHEIAVSIHEGAMAFLFMEYRILIIFVIVVFVILNIFLHWITAVSFLCGAILSTLAGYIGMNIATKANVRTTQAAIEGLACALRVAFSSGAVMGLSVVGFGLLGVSLLYIIFGNPDLIIGFGFGASSVALFARVGGGIYTKAADVGADLVGKVEAGIPEDDPRNPAVIADNVGDNVGDVAGMGADLFESFVGSILSAMVLALVITADTQNFIILPLLIAGAGTLCSIIGTSFVKTNNEKQIHKALNSGLISASIILLPLVFLLVKLVLPVTFVFQNTVYSSIGIFYASA